MEKCIYVANDRLKRELLAWYKEYLQNLGGDGPCCTDDKTNADMHLSDVVEMMFLAEEDRGTNDAER